MALVYGLVEFNDRSEVGSEGRCVSTHMRKYLVRTDSPVFLEGPVIAAAIGITRGSPLASNTNAICRSVEIGPGPVMTKAPFLAYYATYEFSTETPRPENDDDDPVLGRTVWSISPQIQSRYVVKDRHGDLIVNTAGSSYDGGIPVDVRLGSVTARRNVDAAGYNMAGVMANSGKLNSSTFLGGDPETVQVDISASEKYEGAYHFWEEIYTFSYDPQGWQPLPVNAGFFQLIDGEQKRIRKSDLGELADDEEDADVQEPEPLDVNGVLVPVDSRPESCIFVSVEYFETMDFTIFGLL